MDDAASTAAPSSPPQHRLGTWAGPLGNPHFALLFAAQLCSLLGDQLYLVALPFFVLAHATAASLGNVLLVFGLGRVFALPLGGSLADRFTPARVIFIVYIAKAGTLAFLAVAQPRQIWIVMILVALLGISEGLSLPATMSIMPSIVDEQSLPVANSLMSTATMTITLAGPAVAGVIVHVAGTGLAFGLDAVLSLAAIAAMGVLARSLASSPQPGSEAAAAGDGGESAIRSILGLLRTNEILRFSFIITAIIAITYGGIEAIALPVYTTKTLHSGAGDYGLLLSGFAAGGVIGTIAVRGLFKLRRRGDVALAIGIVQGLALAAAPAISYLWFSFAMLFVAGAAQAGLNVFFVTALQQHVSQTVIGKAMSAVLVAAYGGFPVAVFLAGHFIGSVGSAAIFAAGGIVMSIGFACGFLSREFRSL